MSKLKVIDGNVLEGGGQILRNAVSLAGLLKKPITIKNIRYGRAEPGLRYQHLAGLKLAAEISSAKVSDMKIGSTRVDFEPRIDDDEDRRLLEREWSADTVTAGSTTLLMQIALPLLLFASGSRGGDGARSCSNSRTLTLLGGTNASRAPQADYTQHVFVPFLEKHFLPLAPPSLSPSVKVKIKKRGYYPKGGGELQVCVEPLLPGEKLRRVTLSEARGRLTKVGGVVHYSGAQRMDGTEMRKGAIESIEKQIQNLCPDSNIRFINRFGLGSSGDVVVNSLTDGDETKNQCSEVVVDILAKRGLSKGTGSGVVVWAEFENGVVLGASAVREKKLAPSDVGKSAVEELGKAIKGGGFVDEWMQDQMIIFMALAEGKSEVKCGTEEPTLHTRTAIWVAEQLTDAKFTVEREESGHWVIRCEGIGFMN